MLAGSDPTPADALRFLVGCGRLCIYRLPPEIAGPDPPDSAGATEETILAPDAVGRALRDIEDLVRKGVLVKDAAGG